MSKQKYQDSIKIIDNIIDRYNSDFPNIFTNINKYEKILLSENKKHILSKQDCFDVLTEYRSIFRRRITPKDQDVLAECFLLLYNWYKSKVIYAIRDVHLQYSNKKTVINKKLLDLFPYPGIYLDIDFKVLGYVGCFMCITKEKENFSYKKYIMMGFPYYSNKKYIIESFLLPIKDNHKVRHLFENWISENHYRIENMDKNIRCIEMALEHLYKIIESINKRKPIKNTSHIKRSITKNNISLSNNNYRITYQSKYEYKKNNPDIKGTPKRPHYRRSFPRHYKVLDENGNVIGYDIKIIPATQVHKGEQPSFISIKK